MEFVAYRKCSECVRYKPDLLAHYTYAQPWQWYMLAHTLAGELGIVAVKNKMAHSGASSLMILVHGA